MIDGTTPVPNNMIWVCSACGKTSRTKYGFTRDNRNVADKGWDESCLLNAVLCYGDGRENDEHTVDSATAEDSVIEAAGKLWVAVTEQEMP